MSRYLPVGTWVPRGTHELGVRMPLGPLRSVRSRQQFEEEGHPNGSYCAVYPVSSRLVLTQVAWEGSGSYSLVL